MQTFNIDIKSKNKNSINNFILILKKNKCNNLKKYFKKKTKHNKISILKSPHVNKKAQEQFESIVFIKQVTLQTIQNLKYLIFIKKLKFKLFSDIYFKLEYKMNLKEFKKINFKIFSPNNFKIKKYTTLFFKEKLNKLLYVFDFYGEFLKNKFKFK